MKKLQIFVSSTYEDLKEERQAAVGAILDMNHIPAGMEWFFGESEEQMKMIKKWIKDSDVFLLILGGRYGTLYRDTGKSYIHLELEYAISLGIPFRILVMEESMIEKKKIKALENHKGYLYEDNIDKYNDFLKGYSTNMHVSHFDSIDKLKSVIHPTINRMQNNKKLIGWVRGDSPILIDPDIQKACDALGIKQIFTTPRDKDSRRDISTAREIYSIVYVGDKFIEDHRAEFRNAFKNGATISLLVGKKGSDFFRDIEATENVMKNSLDVKIDILIEEYKGIKKKYPLASGKIEIRTFRTEFRNTMTIVKDKNGNLKTQLIVMFPHKRAGDCPMMEIQGGIDNEYCKGYFKTVWNLHENDVDVIYNSDVDN